MSKFIKPSTWFNTKQMKEVFGIKVKFEGEWMNAGDNNGPLFFDTKEERDAKIEELKKQGVRIGA